MFLSFLCKPLIRLERQVAELRASILQTIANGTVMATSLDNLTQEVAQNSDAVNSAITLLNGLKQKLDEAIDANNNGDDSKLQELAASLDSSTNALATAVAQNTPAEGNPTPTEPGTGTPTA